jgi:hypothetical protein
MTTTVKNASSPAVFSKENSASLVDATIFYPKILNSSDEPLASSKIRPLRPTPWVKNAIPPVCPREPIRPA